MAGPSKKNAVSEPWSEEGTPGECVVVASQAGATLSGLASPQCAFVPGACPAHCTLL